MRYSFQYGVFPYTSLIEPVRFRILVTIEGPPEGEIRRGFFSLPLEFSEKFNKVWSKRALMDMFRQRLTAECSISPQNLIHHGETALTIYRVAEGIWFAQPRDRYHTPGIDSQTDFLEQNKDEIDSLMSFVVYGDETPKVWGTYHFNQ